VGGHSDVVDDANRCGELLQREPTGQEPFFPQGPGNLDAGAVSGLRRCRPVDEPLLQSPGVLAAVLVYESGT